MTRSTRDRTARARRRPADRVRVRPRLEGLEDRRLLSVAITEFPTPTAPTQPFWITAGPDGNLWFTEHIGNKIGMINPATHAITEFPIPTANAFPEGISAGPDGNLWFVGLAGQIGMINPATHAITEFPVPTANANLEGISAGPDGNLWFTEVDYNNTTQTYYGQIGEINPATHAIAEFPAPITNALLSTITAGPDGNLWFTEGGGNNIGMINPATHAITEFPIPYANASPTGITAGPDGNLWFTGGGTNSIGMINPTTHAIAGFPVPTANAGLAGITAGPDGNLWFTEQGVEGGFKQAGQIGEINPATHAITEFSIPTGKKKTDISPLGITTGPDGNLWFADRGDGSIGVATLNPASSTHLVVTQTPPASVAAGSPFSLTVQAEDSSGNLVSSFSGTVTVGLARNPGGTTLGGTLVVAALGGVATFSGLTLTQVASGYTLFVSASGPTSTTTGPFNVVSSTPGSALAVTSPTGKPDSLLAPLVLDSPDIGDGLGFKKRAHGV
jgi:streptogramin lyase